MGQSSSSVGCFLLSIYLPLRVSLCAVPVCVPVDLRGRWGGSGEGGGWCGGSLARTGAEARGSFGDAADHQNLAPGGP